MKKLFTSIAVCLTFSASIAQIGAVAPNIITTDIAGNPHNLYTYLDAGKVVIVDMSATWCGPCWGFHTANYLEDLYAEFGPPGTNEVVILFYEDDVSTTLADLYGTGGNTQGDWVTGTPYPIINGTYSLPYPEYGTGYPTVSVICPSDKKIKYNLFDSGSLNQMRTDVQTTIDQCSSSSVSENTIIDLLIAPNPTADVTSIQFNSAVEETATIKLFNVSGQVITSSTHDIVNGSNTIDLDLSSMEIGAYFLQISTSQFSTTLTPLVKK